MTRDVALQALSARGRVAPQTTGVIVPFGAPARLSTVLVLTAGRRQYVSLPAVGGLMFVDPQDLTSAIIAKVSPGLVISPLFTGGHDACDMAAALQRSGFRGQYRIVTGTLPHPGLVLDELRAAGPGIDIDFMDWPI